MLMKSNKVLIAAVVLGAATLATRSQTTPPAALATKVAILDVQGAVLGSQEGRQAFEALQSKYEPRKAQLQKKQDDLQTLQDRLRKGAATMNPAAIAQLQREIAGGTRALSHASDDLNAEANQEQADTSQAIETKLLAVVEKYANRSGYSVVLDVSNQQTPVFWAATASNITDEVVKLYDQAYPGAAAVPKTNPPAGKKQ